MSAARRALDGFERLLELSVFYDASLCVSELVTNAVLHANMGPDDELELDVEISDDALHVAVTDLGGGFDPVTPTPGDESGFGLYIVDRLSDRWGVERGERTRVWFEMARRADVVAQASSRRSRASAETAGDEPRSKGRRRSFTGRGLHALGQRS